MRLPAKLDLLLRNPQILRFAVVGIINTLTDVAVFYLVHRATGMIVISNIVSYGLGAGVSFLLNRNWTFRDTDDGGAILSKILRFAVLNAATLTLSTGVILGLSLVMPVMAAKIISVAIAAAVSFLGMRFFIFGQRG